MNLYLIFFISPIAAKVVIEAKGPENVAIVADSCEAAGIPDGDYELVADWFM